MHLFKTKSVGPAPALLKCPGAKNALLPALYAALLLKGRSTFLNAPTALLDSERTFTLLRSLGVHAEVGEERVCLDASGIGVANLDFEAAGATRYSALLLGVAMALGVSIRIPVPGGCQLKRGLDIHIAGLRGLGAEIDEDGAGISLRPGGPSSGQCYFRLRSPSVGATLNLILATVKGRQAATFANVSIEPEVCSFIELLNTAGARIRWVADRTVSIEPVRALQAVEWTIIPDRIAAMTYMVAATMLERGLVLTGVRPDEMLCPLEVLKEAGLQFEVTPSRGEIRLRPTALRKLRPFSVVAEPYPGFPTDLQPIFAALAGKIDGESSISERVFDTRFEYIPVLQALGSNIRVDGTVAVIRGKLERCPATVSFACTDIRGGMSCTLYAMSQHADFRVHEFSQIQRCYVNLEKMFLSLGYDAIAAADPN